MIGTKVYEVGDSVQHRLNKLLMIVVMINKKSDYPVTCRYFVDGKYMLDYFIFEELESIKE